ncbi:hypothetical protein BDU57DRAFT_514297 [Ampelomyces quisqualis]|uniref:PARP catalytic domain-containing protein n=1 Tax=Ampelomyces quisqualis TaxID=50730 RepID=A0A6A5QR10_AMPQU|nr:hypothetical protein BDU57DRAFT_514297 [Ampelomyces quisqualis]
MDNLIHSSTIDRTAEKRLHISWGKKAIYLKGSTLFGKAKHSEEWHQSIDATAGVLHPSDQKFPYDLLCKHTDTYLKKKGRFNQADVDIRLAILITSHNARDIAVAAAAHVMTATSLRELLHADMNVMHGSFWGLRTWFQCLIAANTGNPAAVTDIEAFWARRLLPFAIQVPRAAEWYLAGIYGVLREVGVANMDSVPEFAVLMRRAIVDFSDRLEGLRLHNQWTAAYKAVSWMVELTKTSPVTTSPGHLLPEHILDSQFPAWRAWTYWTPNLERIKLLSTSISEQLCVVSHLVALEGPDMITGTKCSLREGLIARYNNPKALLQWRGIIIEVSDRTQMGLRGILERTAQYLETVIGTPPLEDHGRFELFRYLVVSQPITTSNLDIFEATCKVPYTSENDVYNTVREIYKNKDRLDGEHVLALQNFTRAINDPTAADLRKIFLQDWLRTGIDRCVRECRKAVYTYIDKGLQWSNIALEYHGFRSALKSSEHYWPFKLQTVNTHPDWPSADDMKALADIHETAEAQQQLRLDSQSPALLDSTAVEKIATGSSPSKTAVYEKSLRHPLLEHTEAYCIDRVLGGQIMSPSSRRTMSAILHVWESTSMPKIDFDRRTLAMLVVESAGTDSTLRCRCLSEIAFTKEMPQPSVQELLTILRISATDLSQAIVKFVKILASRKTWTLCWRSLILAWMERQGQNGGSKQHTVLDHTLHTMKASQWLNFMDSIELVFAHLPFFGSADKILPPIVQPGLLDWKSRVSRYEETLTRLETALGDNLDSVRGILTCYAWTETLVPILDCLKKVQGTPVENIMQNIVSKLSKDAKNSMEIKECMLGLSSATPEAVGTCCRIWDAQHGGLNIPDFPETSPCRRTTLKNRNSARKEVLRKDATSKNPSSGPPTLTRGPYSYRTVPSSVVDVMVAGWILSEDINARDRDTIMSFASVLGICVEAHDDSAWKLKLIEAAKFWEEIENEILKEAARLDDLTKCLQARDPKGTALLLQELGIPGNGPLDDEMAMLPACLVNFVERVGDTQVEISFPLSAFTELQRGALGMPNGANSFLLRLQLPNLEGMPPSFCTHFSHDESLDTIEHTPWICSNDSRSPHENFCTTKQTVFAWQLHRIIHTQLRIGNFGIADLHRIIKKTMEELGHMCVSCGVSHNATKAQLRRATPCNTIACANLWYHLPLDVRIPEIRTDIYAVDAMLTGVHAAAMSGRMELLPSCPIRSTEAVKAILNALPSLRVISHAVNISAVLRSYHKDAEKLISWACVHHRGYIATATGLCKVPTMPPGTHQFVFANSSPRLESDFVSKLSGPASKKTIVLFHGTTLDRLPAILAQGLRIYSGTHLQRTGAAHGKGIYLAEEPATSYTYSPAIVSWRNSGLSNMRLLFGCEVLGMGRSVTKGIHLITDEKAVMVRYVFFLPGGAQVPIANHIVPAMSSGMSALRIGAV